MRATAATAKRDGVGDGAASWAAADVADASSSDVISRVVRIRSTDRQCGSGPEIGSALDAVALGAEVGAHAIARLALDLDGAVADGAAAAAGALQLGAQALQEAGVARQAGDHGHGLAAAAGLLDAEVATIRDRHRLGVAGGAAAGRGRGAALGQSRPASVE